MKNYLSSILDNIDVLVYVADIKTYEVLYINKYTEKILGDIKGKICWQSIQKGQKSPCQFCTNDKILNSDGKPTGVYHWEFQNTATDKWFDIRDSAIEWHDGRIVRLEVATDITHIKKAEEALIESEVKFRSVVESSPMGMHMYNLESDDRLVFVDYNHAADLILGLDNNQFIGKTIEEAFPSLIATEVPERYRRAAARGESWVNDQVTYEDEKITGAFQVHAFRTESGKMVAMFLDITEKMKAEKEQERLTAELTIKNKELEQILYVTSHDLRSPLVNVDGYSKELGYSIKELKKLLDSKDLPLSIREKIAPIIENDIPESLHYISSSTSKMDALLAGMLKLSRTGRADLIMENIEMNEIIADVISSLQMKLNDAGIKTEISELPSCRGDKHQINQMFSNLVGNAVKYLDPDRKGIIKISGHREGNKTVYCVEDNGIGIAPAYQEKIFEVFHQLDPQKAEGEGLGLTIVHKILNRLGGKVWLESTSGKGSKFYVSLPAK